MKLTLIENWKNIWKWYSTHAMFVYMVLVSYYVSLEPSVGISMSLDGADA